jgi:hypothetical protein
MNYLPGLASNSDSSDLCLLSSEDYRCEATMRGSTPVEGIWNLALTSVPQRGERATGSHGAKSKTSAIPWLWGPRRCGLLGWPLGARRSLPGTASQRWPWEASALWGMIPSAPVRCEGPALCL